MDFLLEPNNILSYFWENLVHWAWPEFKCIFIFASKFLFSSDIMWR